MGVPPTALLCGLAGTVLLAALASGEAVPVRIRYEAPTGCPDAQAFFGAVQSRTARVRQAQEGETASVFRIRITRDQHGSVGEVRAVDDGRESAGRRVEGSSCDEVVQALALTVALSVDPTASILPTAPSASAPAPAASSVAPPATPPPRRAPAVVASNRPSQGGPFEVGVEGVVAHNLGPYVNAGGKIFATLQRTTDGVWSPSVELAIAYLRNDMFSQPQDADATLTLAAIVGCPLRWTWTGIADARFCASAEGGSLVVTGRDVLQPRSVARPWLAAGAEGQGRFYLTSKLILKLDVGVMIPFMRRQFVIDNPPRQAADTPPISPFAGLGVAFRP